MEFNPENLKHLPIEEQRQILAAFNLSYFDISNYLDQTSKIIL